MNRTLIPDGRELRMSWADVMGETMAAKAAERAGADPDALPVELVFMGTGAACGVPTYYCECKGDSQFTFHYSEEMLDKWDESKIHEGDTVKVVNTGLNYSSYVQWVGEHISDPYMAARFCFGSPSTDKNYKVIKIAKHGENGRDLAYIEECDGLAYNKCYLIEVKGLEKV